MKRFYGTLALAAFVALTGAVAPAAADSLYAAAQPASPSMQLLRLGPDRRAGQVGDLVYVQFDISATSTTTNVVSNSKSYGISLGPNPSSQTGGGSSVIQIPHTPISFGGSTGSQSNHTKNGQDTFTSTMMAQVVGVLPGGALRIEGDQKVNINGADQVLHVAGLVRPEDIDNTDTVLASHIANVNATFSGDFQKDHTGLIRKILDVLF